MKIGLIGLGRMGYSLALNALDNRQKIVAYDLSEKEIKSIAKKGAVSAFSIEALVNKLPSRKIVWIMVPAGASVDEIIKILISLLKKGDIIIDGGNSFYKDSIKRAKRCAKNGINFLDIGTSGGIDGARNGACMMVGGKKSAYQEVEPFIRAVCTKNGFNYMGESGSGHFVKMIHNGIEYGMMQAIGEGYEMLSRAPFKLDLQKVNKVYENGSVIRGWLIDLVGEEFKKDPLLGKYSGKVGASGEGKWAAEEASRMKIRIPVLEGSLKAREYSQKHPTFGSRILSAMRNAFGGHREQT